MSALRLTDWFDEWVQRGSFDSQSLSVYRVIYSLLALLTMPRFSPLTRYPNSLYRPPPGPFQLMHHFPSGPVLVGLELALSLSLCALLIGFCTEVSSLACGLLYTVGYGLNYSLGKIDHTILLALAPMLLAFSGWGDRLSVDSALGRVGMTRGEPQWIMRLLGLCIGGSFATAALQKLLSGWLLLNSQAVQGHFYVKYVAQRRHSLVGGLAYRVHVAAPWEVLDWATVFLEFSVVIAILSWRSYRYVLAALTLFHLGVLLVLNIKFATNVIVYGAFVSWASVPQLGSRMTHNMSLLRRPRSSTGIVVAASLALPAATLGFWALTRFVPRVGEDTAVAILFVGAAGAICFYFCDVVGRRSRRFARAGV